MVQKFKELVKYSAIAAPVFADSIQLNPGGGFGNQLTGLTVVGIIKVAISLVMIVVALIFFFMLIWGGLRWVMSQGDEKAVTGARGQITNALIGLAIVFAAFAIMKLIGIVFGVDLLGTINIPTFQ